jgi:hypothetical protein
MNIFKGTECSQLAVCRRLFRRVARPALFSAGVNAAHDFWRASAYLEIQLGQIAARAFQFKPVETGFEITGGGHPGVNARSSNPPGKPRERGSKKDDHLQRKATLSAVAAGAFIILALLLSIWLAKN